MNIAFVFFGKLRLFDFTNKTFTSNFMPILQGHNVKYFAHLWEGDNYLSGLSEYENDLNKFKGLYPDVSIVIEKQKSLQEMHDEFEMKKQMHIILMSQTYSFYKAFKHLEEYQNAHNMKFDLYVKLRTDLAFLDKVNLNFDSESIYTKNITHWRPISNYANDFIFFTRSFDSLKTLSNLGFGMDKVLDQKEKLLYTGGPNNDLYCCEEVLARYLNDQKVSMKTYNFNVDLARHHQK